MNSIKYCINKYAAYDTERFFKQGHPADIMDKLIRLTAKLTEAYAGDIYYELTALNDVFYKTSPYDKLLCFREDGVSSYLIEDNTVSFYEGSSMQPGGTEVLQYWRLTYLTEAKEARLYRASLKQIKSCSRGEDA